MDGGVSSYPVRGVAPARCEVTVYRKRRARLDDESSRGRDVGWHPKDVSVAPRSKVGHECIDDGLSRVIGVQSSQLGPVVGRPIDHPDQDIEPTHLIVELANDGLELHRRVWRSLPFTRSDKLREAIANHQMISNELEQ